MAEAFRTVNGEATGGVRETIIPGLLINPNGRIDYGPYAIDIPFTHIQRVVNLEQKTQMQDNGCLSSMKKKYDEDGNGEPERATFSWWSVYLDNKARDIVMRNRKEGWEIEPFFKGKSLFGDHRLILPLDRMMEVYSVHSDADPVMRILGTFYYKREWMHTFVITPSNDWTFQNHPVAATFDGTLAWYPDLSVQADNATYEWNAFSTVKWDGSAKGDRKRMWDHLSFAFHLDPLPETVLQLHEEDVMDEKWETVPS